MDKAKFVELLQALNSNVNTDRQKAETMYQQGKKTEPEAVLLGITQVVGSADVNEDLRRHGAVLLRQLMDTGKDFIFGKVSPQTQHNVAAELLRLFSVEPIPKLQKKMGEVIDRLAMSVAGPGTQRVAGMPNGWPELLPMVFRMACPSTSTSADACENAIRLLQELVSTLEQSIIAAQQELSQVIQGALSHPNLKIRLAAVRLVCALVTEVEKEKWQSLTVTIPVMVQVIRQLAATPDEIDLLQDGIQALTEVATTEPDFFKESLMQPGMEPAAVLAEVARSRQISEPGVRTLALEWLVSFIESKEKWVRKHLQALPPMVIEVCMAFMLEVEDGEEELKEWCEHMDDEEGEEDEDNIFHSGEEALDRIANALPSDVVFPPLQLLIAQFTGRSEWQAKHAALAAMRQTVEYAEADKPVIDGMWQLAAQHMEHAHPRVRYASLHMLGQMANDQAPHFQEASYKTLMPMFLAKMDDPVDRVAAMSMSAFVSFGEELDNSLMADYAHGFMEKLVTKLSSSNRLVKEEAITSIAVIAGVIEKDFSRYYSGIMPLLKQFVLHATGEKENKLRGKAFECMSLLGIAVGKEQFLPDAREAIGAMMSTNVEADDLQREYISQASERICTCLKKDFAPFLPSILPGLFKRLKLEDEPQATNGAAPAKDDDDDEEYIRVSTGEGKLIRVKTTRFEELTQAASMLHTICQELEGEVFDYVPTIAEALLPLFSATDEVSALCEDARAVALQTWALLIKARRAGAQARGVADPVTVQLLQTGLQKIFANMKEVDDAEVIGDMANGIAECVRNVGPGVLGAQEMQQLVEQVIKMVEESMKRSAETEKDNKNAKDAAGPAADDDDNSEDEEEDEVLCRRQLVDVLGAIMEVGAAEFSASCLAPCCQKMAAWLADPRHVVLGLYHGCDMLKHLKERSEPFWPTFMPEVFKALSSPDKEAVTAAAFAVNLAARLPNFAMAAPEAFRKIGQIVAGPKPKKRDTKGKQALDNAVAALVSLAKDQSAQCPPEVQPWTLALSKLPLRDDEDEAKEVHDKMVDLVIAQNESLLGGPGHTNLPSILSFLAEIHHVESICTEETDKKIQQIFTMLPAEMLTSCAAGFSEKQQKKIQKMRAAGA